MLISTSQVQRHAPAIQLLGGRILDGAGSLMVAGKSFKMVDVTNGNPARVQEPDQILGPDWGLVAKHDSTLTKLATTRQAIRKISYSLIDLQKNKTKQNKQINKYTK